MTWIDPLATMTAGILGAIATFGGAWLAFHLEARRRADEERQRQRASANAAILKLFGMWNFLEIWRQEIIEPVRNDPLAMLNMRVSPLSPHGVTDVQVAEVAFLLQTRHANVAHDLMLEVQRFWNAVGLMESRNALMREKVMPAIATANLPQQPTENQLRQLLGPQVHFELRNLSEGIVRCVTEDVSSLFAIIRKFRAATKELHPHLGVIDVFSGNRP